ELGHRQAMEGSGDGRRSRCEESRAREGRLSHPPTQLHHDGGLMPAPQHPLVKAFGPADPRLKMGVRFQGGMQGIWEDATEHLSAGYYLHGFLRLFDEGLAELSKALDAWSFLVPPSKDRLILGCNAYGSMLVLERANSGRGRVHILDPFRLSYVS